MMFIERNLLHRDCQSRGGVGLCGAARVMGSDRYRVGGRLRTAAATTSAATSARREQSERDQHACEGKRRGTGTADAEVARGPEQRHPC